MEDESKEKMVMYPPRAPPFHKSDPWAACNAVASPFELKLISIELNRNEWIITHNEELGIGVMAFNAIKVVTDGDHVLGSVDRISSRV